MYFELGSLDFTLRSLICDVQTEHVHLHLYICKYYLWTPLAFQSPPRGGAETSSIFIIIHTRSHFAFSFAAKTQKDILGKKVNLMAGIKLISTHTRTIDSKSSKPYTVYQSRAHIVSLRVMQLNGHILALEIIVSRWTRTFLMMDRNFVVWQAKNV